MNCLITGATGFVGRRLVEKLLASGHSVQYLGRNRDKKMDSRAAFHSWDEPSVTAPPLNAIPRMDAVIHLAGEPIAQRWTEDTKRKIAESRIVSTKNLVASIAALRHKPQVLVCASAIGYYGDRGNEVLTESAPAGRGFLADLCAAWEAEADKAQATGLRVVKIRIGVVLGQGGALGQMIPPFRLGVGGRFGDGNQWMSWIDREDLIDMMRWAIETDTVNGVLNGTAPEPVTNMQFTKILAAALHRPAVIPMPKFALQLILGEMAQFLFNSTRAIPAAATSQGFAFRYNKLEDSIRQVLRQSV
jgi:uncharacterized protein (TIGR01777 family)